jgi:hypothetical protein
MKIEIMTNGKFKNLSKQHGWDANRVYRTPADDNRKRPYFEIWEVEKSDIKNIENVCLIEDVFACYSKGVGGATPFEFLTINGKFVIGWTAKNNKDTFECLTEYFKDGLGVTNARDMCAYATTLAKTNGWTLSKTFKLLED